MMAERYPSYDLFGAKITPTTAGDLLSILDSYIGAGRQCVIASQNMHGLHIALRDASFARLHCLPDTYVHIDGMPLVLLCKLRGIAASCNHRVTLVDWIWPLLQHAADEGWRLYYLGATESVLRDGTAVILARIPHLALKTHHGYIVDAEGNADPAVLDDVARYRPHLVLVGMGMGPQEHWILENLQALAPACVCTVGACIEYIAGAVKTPPRWMGRVGLEWLFRFAENPTRFWYRYLIEPWFVLAHVARSMAASRREPASP